MKKYFGILFCLMIATNAWSMGEQPPSSQVESLQKTKRGTPIFNDCSKQYQYAQGFQRQYMNDKKNPPPLIQVINVYQDFDQLCIEPNQNIQSQWAQETHYLLAKYLYATHAYSAALQQAQKFLENYQSKDVKQADIQTIQIQIYVQRNQHVTVNRLVDEFIKKSGAQDFQKYEVLKVAVNSYERQKQWDQAILAQQKIRALKVSPTAKNLAFYHEARYYLAQNNPQKAKTILKSLVQQAVSNGEKMDRGFNLIVKQELDQLERKIK